MQYEGVIPEHRAVRTDAGVFDVSHMGEIEVEGPTRARPPAGDCSRTTSTGSSAGEAQYTLLTNERGGIVDDLIVYRLDAAPLPARRQRVEPRRRLRLAEGARAARLRRARRLRRLRAARRAGAARARAARRSRTAKPFTLGDGRARRRRGDGQPHRLHRRGGRRARVHGRRRRRALGRDPRARRRARAGSARATRCASRSATRCTATTSARSGTRSRPGSAGRARSTRSSPASSALREIKEHGPEQQARPVRDDREGDPAPGHADRGRRRGHLGLASRRCSTSASASATCPPRRRSRAPSS